jgi:hypothetical protein
MKTVAFIGVSAGITTSLVVSVPFEKEGGRVF